MLRLSIEFDISPERGADLVLKFGYEAAAQKALIQRYLLGEVELRAKGCLSGGVAKAQPKLARAKRVASLPSSPKPRTRTKATRLGSAARPNQHWSTRRAPSGLTHPSTWK